MQRRKLVQGLGTLCLSGLASCHRPTTRERALESIARQVVAPGIAEIVEQSRELASACKALGGAFAPEKLQAAQRAFCRAALIWKRAGTFRDGPFQEGNALLRATRTPPRPHVIEAVLAESRPIDAARIAELGSGEKGLYAIECLLFDAYGRVALERFRSASGPRAQALCLGLANELVELAEKIEQAAGSRGKRLAEELQQSPQSSLSRLVNTLIEGLELMAEGQLGLVWHLTEVKRLEGKDVEGFWSRTSQQLALARLEGAEQIYRAGEHSLSNLVRLSAPNADDSVRERLDGALRSMRAVTLPLEDAATQQRSRLYEAYLKVKSLEAGMKVHLPSALGVTITFSSTDAD
ncbi:MAG: imelysin family protein [Polyangiaceae bacterium]